MSCSSFVTFTPKWKVNHAWLWPTLAFVFLWPRWKGCMPLNLEKECDLLPSFIRTGFESLTGCCAALSTSVSREGTAPAGPFRQRGLFTMRPCAADRQRSSSKNVTAASEKSAVVDLPLLGRSISWKNITWRLRAGKRMGLPSVVLRLGPGYITLMYSSWTLRHRPASLNKPAVQPII